MIENRFHIRRGDEGWPALMVEECGVHELYGIGDKSILDTPCISIIGARRGTPYGIQVAKLVARLAAERGITVVSGGALGVDSAAALAAIDAGGKTILVAGGGADVIYPPSSKALYEACWKDKGCVVSLFNYGAQPQRWRFPKRNKVIAALSKVLVVTEASIPSGTFSTADMALDLGRTLFAAPGSIFSPYAKGTNKLIEEGARVLVDIPGIEVALAQEYQLLARNVSDIKLPDNGSVLKTLVAEPLRPDDLARLLDMQVLALMQVLTQYEVDGLVERLCDGRYTATEKALLVPM